MTSDLAPIRWNPSITEETLKVSTLNSEKVFLLQEGQTIRELGTETFKNPWPRACEALEKERILQKPFPQVKDLRATWKTNARRSGIDSEIREAILGHAERGKSVIERYGRISNEELLQAIDSMTFDHGPTEILVAGEKRPPLKKPEHFLNMKRGTKENQEVAVNLSS